MAWSRYVSVSERERNAERERRKLAKRGVQMCPVSCEGRIIAHTFWGRSWCENLERYSDYANRLPRGRTYLRNGSVLDLQIEAGAIRARVSGSRIYTVSVQVAPLPATHWNALRAECVGAIDSMVELLQGRFSTGVMERICRPGSGLFPSPREIRLSCSCPDWADMCKHVAAVLYGVGVRLDEQPELLFLLREVDEQELVAEASAGAVLAHASPTSDKVLASDDLSALFGIDLGVPEAPAPPPPRTKANAAKPKAARPKVADPKPAKAKAAEPKVVQPKAAEPKVVQPKAAEPKVVRPKAAEPKATKPKVAEPRPPVAAPRPKPTRCAHRGCRLTARPGLDGLCHVHWVLRNG